MRAGSSLLLLLSVTACSRSAREPVPPGEIAFVSERDGNREVYVIASDGSGERRLTESPGEDYPAAISPDGRSALVVRAEEVEGQHVETLLRVPLDGGAPTVLSERAPRNRHPSFTPDGRWVVFESAPAGVSNVYRVRPDGSGREQLTQAAEGDFDPTVDASGVRVVFTSSRDGDPEIYRLPLAGGTPERLTAFYREDFAPLSLPGSEQLVFLSDRGQGFERLYGMARDGTGVHPLVAEADAPGAHRDPAISPDGRRLAFVAGVSPEKTRLYVLELATGGVKAVSPAEGRAETPCWSPDGAMLAFAYALPGQAPTLYRVAPDGARLARIGKLPGAAWLPRWFIPSGGPTLGPTKEGNLRAGR